MVSPKLLLISPVFHGYWKTIQDSLVALGYDVTTHLYDAPGTIPARIKNKVVHDLPQKFQPSGAENNITDEVIAKFKQVKPDVVLTVKGDILGRRWLEHLNESGVRFGTWMYDELRRMRYTPADYELLGNLASYSPADVDALCSRGLNAIEVPLAYDASMPLGQEICQAISFVGARYGNRELMLKNLASSGIPIKAYGKQWSRHWWDIARTRNFAPAGFETGRDLSRSNAYSVMASSPATINIHGDQDGFTMRTFEAAGVGGVQILDRADVDRYYDPGSEVLVYESEEELLELCKRVLSDSYWSRKIREAGQKRTLAEHTFAHRVKKLEQLWA